MIRFLRRHFRKPWCCINIREDYTSEEAWFWFGSNAMKWVEERGRDEEGYYRACRVYCWPIDYWNMKLS